MNRQRSQAKPCTGCGQETACAYYDGDRKVRLCPECLDRMMEPSSPVSLGELGASCSDGYGVNVVNVVATVLQVVGFERIQV